MEGRLSAGPFSGTVRVPASKSLAHRFLIAAALSDKNYQLPQDSVSDDLRATLRCLDALRAREKDLFCGGSGSTLRFLLPVIGALGREAVFFMDGNLPGRPHATLIEELCRHGMTAEQDGNTLRCGGQLRGGAYRIPGDISSQFVTGLLFALPLLAEESTLEITGELQSAPYVTLTEETLVKAGIRFQKEGALYRIPGGQRYDFPADMPLEGDWSAAAPYLCMGALSEEGVRVENLRADSSQGDRRIVGILREMGARVETEEECVFVRKGELRGISVDAADIPDLVPVICALAALAEGRSEITRAARLRGKESDRIGTTARMLRGLGARIETTADGLVIEGQESLAGGRAETFGDHRVAFAAAVAACGCREDVIVADADCVSKSWPDFWTRGTVPLLAFCPQAGEDQMLNQYREEIDQIDDRLADLFARRMALVDEIAALKREQGLPVRDPAREAELLARLRAQVPAECAADTEELFGAILAISKKRQAGQDPKAADITEASRDKGGEKVFGLLGQHLSHSWSPQIHALLGNPGYRLFDKEPAEAALFLAGGEWDGLNVTMPYKKEALQYCDELSADAARAGSVNTLARRPDGKICGDNTDVAGFRALLARSGFSAAGKKAVVLGSGGAAATVRLVLSDLGAETVIISRQGEDNYENLSRHADAKILINATPVGMGTLADQSPVDLSAFPALEQVIDLIYNPARTRLLAEAEARQIPCANGFLMLLIQALKSAERFGSRRNLVLIGMPGAGKSTFAAELGKILDREVADSDELIEARTGLSPAAFIETRGEAAFREAEAAVLRELGRRGKLVIATGGGCVTRAENYEALHKNGLILWLQRDPDKLARDDRPLSEGDLSLLYRERAPLYALFADCVIEDGPH